MSKKRTYIIGDEWLYYKLYCGQRMADIILTETIKPLVQKFTKQKLIKKWFFIRYNDPDFHLRIRFQIINIEDIGLIILEINKAIKRYIKEDIIYKVQTDTYVRELERYGINTIEISEDLFYEESEMLLKVLDHVKDEDTFFLFILKVIDQQLDYFKLSLEEKLNFVTINAGAYEEEFQVNNMFYKKLNKKYRDLNKEMHLFFDSSSKRKDNFKFLNQILNNKNEQSRILAKKILNFAKRGTLQVSLNSLVSSYIHMFINRSFRTKQRFYELVIYCFLKNYYKSCVFIQKNKTLN